MGFEYGYCLVEGCGERYVRENRMQKYCPTHLYKNQQPEVKKKAAIKCQVCKKSFVPKAANAKFCGDACYTANKVIKKREYRKKNKKKALGTFGAKHCVSCGLKFNKVEPLQTMCAPCNIKPKAGAVSFKPGKTMAPIKRRASDLPCFDCKHSKANQAATYGIECSIGFWLRCKPLNPGVKPLEVRDEALDVTA